MEARDRGGVSEPRLVIVIDEMAGLVMGRGEEELGLAAGNEIGLH